MSKFRLITGGIGTGKTLFVVDELFKLKADEPDLKIYTDITGIQHTGITTIPVDFDWRDAENNSLIVFDEVQYKTLFSRHNSKRDQQILDLTTIRKRGIQLWIITQRARFLNPDVLGLVNEHVHIEKNSKKSSKIYVFLEAETNITKLKKQFAFRKFVFQYPEHLYGFYESVQEGAKHYTRSWLHQGIIAIVITMIIALIGFGVTIYNGTKHGLSIGDEPPPSFGSDPTKAKLTDKQTSNKLPPSENKLPPNISDQQLSKIDEYCRMGKNVDLPECKNFYDTFRSDASSPTEQQTTVYDPNNPYSFVYVPSEIEPTDFPRMSGVITQSNGYLIAIDQQGNYMPNISQEDCKKWLLGYRPFDYFKRDGQFASSRNKKEEK